MKRLLAGFPLCIAMFVPSAQGAAASGMVICGVMEAAGLSMPERHAAIKTELEAGIGTGVWSGQAQMGAASCSETAVRDRDEMPVWQDIQSASDTPDHSSAASR